MGKDRALDRTPPILRKPRFLTARGRVESRLSTAAAATVMERWSAHLRPYYPPHASAQISPASPVRHDLNPADRIETWTEQVWVSVPDRSRIEGFDPQGRAFRIVVGMQAWVEHTPFGHRIGWERPDDPADRLLNTQHREPALALLEPWRLIHGYALRDLGEVDVAGRQGLRLQGTPTYDARAVYESGGDDEPFVFVGAEAAEFVVDVEWGVLLRWSGFVDGCEYSVTSFTALTFNEMLDDRLFDPSPGITVNESQDNAP